MKRPPQPPTGIPAIIDLLVQYRTHILYAITGPWLAEESEKLSKRHFRAAHEIARRLAPSESDYARHVSEKHRDFVRSLRRKDLNAWHRVIFWVTESRSGTGEAVQTDQRFMSKLAHTELIKTPGQRRLGELDGYARMLSVLAEKSPFGIDCKICQINVHKSSGKSTQVQIDCPDPETAERILQLLGCQTSGAKSSFHLVLGNHGTSEHAIPQEGEH